MVPADVILARRGALGALAFALLAAALASLAVAPVGPAAARGRQPQGAGGQPQGAGGLRTSGHLRRTGGLRAGGQPWQAPGTAGYSALLEQCTASAVAGERSVTFTGQMVAVAGTQRMAMRIVLQERAEGASAFHDVTATGLGMWRSSEPGVKIYRYVKQIANLEAPAEYRALVRFRWLADRGRVIRRAGLRTASCDQPLISATS